VKDPRQRRGQETIRSVVETERRAAREAAIAVLEDDRYLRLLERLEGAGDPPAAAEPSSKTLAEVWAKEFKRLRRTFRDLTAEATDAELHRARIRAKRARYTAELALHELGDAGERFVSATKRLQDVLGEHQDACVAIERIAVWAEKIEGGPEAAGAIVALEGGRKKRARAEWPKAWKRVERKGRAARSVLE